MPLDRFTKKHAGNWAIALLVVLNLLVIGTFWYTQLRRPPLPVPPPEPNEIGPEMSDIMPFITRELGLSPFQMQRLQAMRERALPEIRAKWQEMQQLRRMLNAQLFDKATDPNEIQNRARRIGELQADLEWTKYEHLLAIKAICTPRQRERLRNLLDDVIQLTRPPGRPGHGNPMRPGRGFSGARRGPNGPGPQEPMP